MQLDREFINLSFNGLLIPFYIYPYDEINNDFVSDFYKVIEMSKYNVDVYVIMNVENGPGLNYNRFYDLSIRKLYSAGVKVLGYVPLKQGEKDEKVVKSYINLQFIRYPYLGGIFLDEFPSSITAEKYIYSIITYINRFRKKHIFVNPGEVIDEELYLKLQDKVSGFIFYEEEGFKEDKFLESTYKFLNRNKSAFIAYNTSIPSPDKIKLIQKYFKYVQFCSQEYVTVDDFMLDYVKTYI